MNLEIKEAKRAESFARTRDIAAAQRGELDRRALALASHCGGLPNSTIRFDAVKLYPLRPNGEDDVDDQ